jgi:hypothetical protein
METLTCLGRIGVTWRGLRRGWSGEVEEEVVLGGDVDEREPLHGQTAQMGNDEETEREAVGEKTEREAVGEKTEREPPPEARRRGRRRGHNSSFISSAANL